MIDALFVGLYFVVWFVFLKQIRLIWLLRSRSFYFHANEKRWKKLWLDLPDDRGDRYASFFKGRFYQRVENKMYKAGLFGRYDALIFLILTIAIPFLLMMLAWIISGLEIVTTGMMAFFMGVICHLYIKTKTRHMTVIFEKNAWRIYRYLHNQTAAGVKITDAIQSIYEVAHHQNLKSILKRFAASFHLTLNVEKSLEEITDRFDGQEAAMLCLAIREGIKTGESASMLKRQEDLMFNQYFNRLEAQTSRRRGLCALSAAFFCMIIILLTAIPIGLDLLQAFDRIF